MKFSVLASFSGVLNDGYWPCDTTLSDALNAAGHIDPEANHFEDLSPLGESKYSYLADESCTCPEDGAINPVEKLQSARDYLLELFNEQSRDDTPEALWNDTDTAAETLDKLADELCEDGEDYPHHDKDCSGYWWSKLQDFQCSGIVSKEDLESFLEDLDAHTENCPTMGTLGGPMFAAFGARIVWDVPFITESQALISSIRVTPIAWNVAKDRPIELPMCDLAKRYPKARIIAHREQADRIASKWQRWLRNALLSKYGFSYEAAKVRGSRCYCAHCRRSLNVRGVPCWRCGSAETIETPETSVFTHREPHDDWS